MRNLRQSAGSVGRHDELCVRRATRGFASAAVLLLALGACDREPDIVATAAAEGIAAADFDLDATAKLIRTGKVKDGAALERELNRSGRSFVDVDRDGIRDPIQVVERREGDRHILEVRAIPSSTRRLNADRIAVPVTEIAIVPADGKAEVSVRYLDDFVHEERAPIVFRAPVAAGTFCHWVLRVDRPVFVGTYYVETPYR